MQPVFEFFGCGSVDLAAVHLEEDGNDLLSIMGDFQKLYQSTEENIRREVQRMV